MWKESVLVIVFGTVALVGAIGAMYQIYRMTEADARARGLKHPRFWGLLAMNGNNSSGLLLYLLGRRNFLWSVKVKLSAVKQRPERKKRELV